MYCEGIFSWCSVVCHWLYFHFQSIPNRLEQPLVHKSTRIHFHSPICPVSPGGMWFSKPWHWTSFPIKWKYFSLKYIKQRLQMQFTTWVITMVHTKPLWSCCAFKLHLAVCGWIAFEQQLNDKYCLLISLAIVLLLPPYVTTCICPNVYCHFIIKVPLITYGNKWAVCLYSAHISLAKTKCHF